MRRVKCRMLRLLAPFILTTGLIVCIFVGIPYGIEPDHYMYVDSTLLLRRGEKSYSGSEACPAKEQPNVDSKGTPSNSPLSLLKTQAGQRRMYLSYPMHLKYSTEGTCRAHPVATENTASSASRTKTTGS